RPAGPSGSPSHAFALPPGVRMSEPDAHHEPFGTSVLLARTLNLISGMPDAKKKPSGQSIKGHTAAAACPSTATYYQLAAHIVPIPKPAGAREQGWYRSTSSCSCSPRYKTSGHRQPVPSPLLPADRPSVSACWRSTWLS